MRGIRSKFRDIFRTQPNILAFDCELFSQKRTIVHVQLGSKYASEVKDKNTRTTSLTLFWELNVDFEHISHIGVHIFHTLTLRLLTLDK